MGRRVQALVHSLSGTVVGQSGFDVTIGQLCVIGVWHASASPDTRHCPTASSKSKVKSCSYSICLFCPTVLRKCLNTQELAKNELFWYLRVNLKVISGRKKLHLDELFDKPVRVLQQQSRCTGAIPLSLPQKPDSIGAGDSSVWNLPRFQWMNLSNHE